MRHVVVTGAAGFIGSHVSEALLRGGWRVTGMDAFDDFYDPAVKRRNVAPYQKEHAFSLVEADIRDIDAADRVMRENVDAVIHLAARAGVRPSIEQPLLYEDVNVKGTAVLLDAARKHGIPKFIFASSSSVYGNNKKVPFCESDDISRPISPYAATKRAGELLCHVYHHLFGIDMTCLRFFTVYGPRQRPDLAIHKFARLIVAGKPIPLFGDDGTKRDYTYIDDIVAGVLAALDRCGGYRIYNLGNSNPVSLKQLVAMIEAALHRKALLEHLPHQPGDVNCTFADISLATKELGFNPRTDLRTGLAKFVDWLSP